MDNESLLPPLRPVTEDEAALLLAQAVRRLEDAKSEDASERAAVDAVLARVAAMQSLLRLLQRLRPDADDGERWAKAAVEARTLQTRLQQAHATIALGTPSATAGYHPGLVRALAGTAPPRLLPRPSRADAYGALLKLAADMLLLCGMVATTTLIETVVSRRPGRWGRDVRRGGDWLFSPIPVGCVPARGAARAAGLHRGCWTTSWDVPTRPTLSYDRSCG